MADEGAAHAVVLHVPEAAGLHCIAVVHHDGLDGRAQCVGLHVHAGPLAGEVHLHDGVALGKHVFLVERLRALVGIAVHDDVLQPAGRVVARPEELFAFLEAGQFLGSMELAGEDLPCQVVGHLRVFLLQFLDEAVHLGARQEVNHLLLVVGAELLEVFFARAVDGEHNLVHSIFVAHEAHAGAGELCLVDVDLYDVAEDAEGLIQVLRLNLHDAERPFALRQIGHVGVEDVEEGASGGVVPGLVVEHDEHLVGASAGLREEVFLLAAGQKQQAGHQ